MKNLSLDIPEPSFQVSEAINQLRVNLSFCGDDTKTIMVTSSIPDEGKSYVSVHLWKMMADIGVKSILIDCDLRKSAICEDYDIALEEEVDNPEGLVHYLAGKSDLQDVLYKTNLPNAYIIPVFQRAGNPPLLLENGRLEELLKFLRKYYDCIIVDTPPLSGVADALRIVESCDGTLLVVGAGDTPKKIIMESVERLKRTGKPLLGTVLNRAEMTKHSSGYYEYRYGYGYGNYR